MGSSIISEDDLKNILIKKDINTYKKNITYVFSMYLLSLIYFYYLN